jgi:hypothetical protein
VLLVLFGHRPLRFRTLSQVVVSPVCQSLCASGVMFTSLHIAKGVRCG